MIEIVKGLGLFLAAIAFACFFGYFKGWCCDGGMLGAEFHIEQEKVEKKIRQQIRKMVAAEREAKRLAVIITNGTDEDPNDYLETVRNLLYPATISSEPQLPIPSHLSAINPTRIIINPSSSTNVDDNMAQSTNSDLESQPVLSMTTPMGMSRHSHPLDILPDYEYESYEYNPETDQPPSYEDCMKNFKRYSYV